MFITFEGIDGSGKTTQSKLLQEYLLEQNQSVVLTKEIGGSDFGLGIRDLVFQYYGKITDLSELLCIMSARAEHIDKIIAPALKNNSIVICDRFIDSTACYQALKVSIEESKDASRHKIEQIYVLHEQFFNVWPDVTFLIEVQLEQTIQNLSNRTDINALDLMDQRHKLQLMQNYQIIAQMQNKRIIKINGNQSIIEVHKEILGHVQSLLRFV